MPDLKPQIKAIMDKPMDRRQFLGFVGAATLVVSGAAGIIGGLANLSGRDITKGYGADPYGGSSKPSSQRVK